ALFTGKRNTSVIAWRAILKEMGIQRRMSTSQARKKWENLKKKYKVSYHNPPPGVSVNPTNWQWFSLMEDAIEGRLNNSEELLSTASLGDDCDYRPDKPRKRTHEPYRSEIELLVEGDDIERSLLERERAALERERMVMDREQAGLERELAALQRERASLEREKAAVERERASVEHQRAQLEKERAEMDRERARLDRDRAALERQRRGGMSDGSHGDDQLADVEMEPASIERRQKFLDLFEKLIENF
uniref:Uncharacterized protein n=1 Tax=Electrophorus electricus TaxID=8005 RepID=A0A4W4FVV5_ELEEL